MVCREHFDGLDETRRSQRSCLVHPKSWRKGKSNHQNAYQEIDCVTGESPVDACVLQGMLIVPRSIRIQFRSYPNV